MISDVQFNAIFTRVLTEAGSDLTLRWLLKFLSLSSSWPFIYFLFITVCHTVSETAYSLRYSTTRRLLI